MRIGFGIGVDMLMAFAVPAAPAKPTLTAPADASSIAIGLGTTVSATTTDTIDRIDWVLDRSGPGTGGTIIATDSTASYSQTWTVASALGSHTLVARAVRGGEVTDSDPINITISDDPALVFGAAAALWLTARQEVFEATSDPAEDGDTVAIWGNVGASTFSDATEATNPPTYRATGGPSSNPAIEFDGTNDQMVGTITGSSSGDSWVVWVLYNPDLHNNRTIFDASDTTATNRGITAFNAVAPTATFRWGNAAGNNASTGTPAATGTWRVMCLQGTTTSRTVYENNVALTGGTNPETTSRAIAAIANYKLGRLFGDVFPFDGKICTVIVKKGTVTSQERADIQTMLQASWGF